MSRNDTIGIVGRITAVPELIIDAAGWKQRVYETTLVRMRPSGTEDTYILQFDGNAAGSEEMLDKITEGAEVLIGGEIRSENVRNPKPEENRVKLYIYADVVIVNNPRAEDQNEVKICGYICWSTRIKKTKRRLSNGKKVTAADIMVAVRTPKGTYYIPCVCWNQLANRASTLKAGNYVEIYGRFQSRNFKKRIKGRPLPFLCTTHEVSVIDLDSDGTNRRKKEGGTDA